MKETTIHISTRTIFITFLSLISIFLIYQVRDILVTLFLSLIIMSAFNPGVTWFEKKKVPRPLGITILYLLVFGALSLLFTLIIPPLAGELSNMVRQFEIPNLPRELTELKFTIQDIGTLLGQVGSSLTSVFSVISTTFSGVFFFFTLMVMSFYLLLERKQLHKKLFWIKHPQRYEDLMKEFIDQMELQLGGWVRGQLLLMLSIGMITYVVLALLNIPYALPLAVLAGLFEILPNLGPTIAAIPAIIVALLFVSPTMAVIVMVLYIAIQQLENNVFVPRIMKAAVNVEPLTSIVLILVGVRIGESVVGNNVLGALLAIPIYIVIRTGVQIYLRENHKA